MRYLILLLITFIFAACGNQKMRFIRTKTTKQKVVELAEIPSLKKKSETYITPESTQVLSESEEVPSSSHTVLSDQDESTENTSVNSDEFAFESQPPISLEDSTTVRAQEAENITNEALRAERDGTRSLVFSILIFAFSIISFVAILVFALSNGSYLIGIILFFTFLGAMLGSLISSLFYGIRSLRSAYNTEKGRRRAITGLIISSIFLALLLLNFALSFL